MSKLLNKIISKRLWWFLSKNNLLHPNQIGFKKGKSIYDSLIFLDHIISHSISSGKHISLISLDFAKAYDKIRIHTILDQLIQWKVRPNIFKYIYNFLNNRKLRVQVNSAHSNIYPINNGIPQGSPISVVLFLIAYNKLCNIIPLHKELSFIAYADDFVILRKQNKSKNQDINLEPLLDKILSWCKYSGTSLSVSKCQQIHICRKHHCTSKLLWNYSHVPTVDSFKILGLTFNKRYR